MTVEEDVLRAEAAALCEEPVFNLPGEDSSDEEGEVLSGHDSEFYKDVTSQPQIPPLISKKVARVRFFGRAAENRAVFLSFSGVILVVVVVELNHPAP